MMDEAKTRLMALDAIPEVKFVQVGVNDIKSERSYDFVLIMDFDNMDTYQAYDKHEMHVPVRDFIHSIISEAVAVDFFTD